MLKRSVSCNASTGGSKSGSMPCIWTNWIGESMRSSSIARRRSSGPEQCRIVRDVSGHQAAERNYIEEGIKLLELAQRTHVLFERQAPVEKRRLLDFVLSNCQWRGGGLAAEYRQPFDLIACAASTGSAPPPGGCAGRGDFDNWRRKRDSNGCWGIEPIDLTGWPCAACALCSPSEKFSHVIHTRVSGVRGAARPYFVLETGFRPVPRKARAKPPARFLPP